MFSNIIRKTAKQTTKSFVRQVSNATTKQASTHSKRLIYSLGGLGVGAAATYASMDQTSTPRMANKSIYGMLESFGDRLDRIEEALGVGLSVFSDEIQKIREVKVSNPGNRAMKYFDEAYFAKLGLPLQQVFIDIVRTGFENADSGLGCYAMKPDDYETFSEFFDPLIRDYHGASPDAVHVTDWDISDVGENGVLDVTKLGCQLCPCVCVSVVI